MELKKLKLSVSDLKSLPKGYELRDEKLLYYNRALTNEECEKVHECLKTKMDQFK